ncbi:MAG: L,D-transpeptidase family protein [Cyclobacteriaceae bacterium]
MRNFLIYFLITLFTFVGSCSRRSAPDKVENKDVDPLEAKLFMESPGSIKKVDRRNEIISSIVKQYLDTVDAKQIVQDSYRQDYLQNLIMDLYQTNDYNLLWNEFLEPSEKLNSLISYIKQSENVGLEPENYNYSYMQELINKAYVDGALQDMLSLLQLDICATSSAIVLSSHLNAGRISPDKIDTAWFVNPPKLDYAKYIDQALQGGSIQNAFEKLQPNIDHYWKLASKLKKYHKIKRNGGFPSLPSVNQLSAGDSTSLIRPVKKLLAATGDLEDMTENSNITNEYKQALRQYQMRMDLPVTGSLNEATLRAMKVPVEQRIATIALNMERLRWFEEFEEEYILINVPEFRMQVRKNDQEVIGMKVVVGKEYDSTPIFSDELEYLVFNPHWTVPLSIASEELLPKIKSNPEFLTVNNYKLMDGWDRNAKEVNPEQVNWSDIDEDNFPYVIVQESGKSNALGAVKFMFPNEYSIYMHDTPADYLFEKENRDYSHGCIRLERPFKLAKYLLRNKEGWNQQKQREVMDKEEPVTVNLPESLPVNIVYLTSWVDEDGNLNFRDDLYGHDQAQLRALEEKMESL